MGLPEGKADVEAVLPIRLKAWRSTYRMTANATCLHPPTGMCRVSGGGKSLRVPLMPIEKSGFASRFGEV